jgi:hypothetical protein
MNVVTTRNTILGGFLALLILLPSSGKSSAERTGDMLIGRWLFPSKGSSVDVFKSDGMYFARVADVDPAGVKNFGLEKNRVIISNLTFDGKLWTGGELIHPKTGTQLDVELNMADPQRITVTIYKGFKFLHKKFDMTRQAI